MQKDVFNQNASQIQVGVLDTRRSHGYGESAQTNDVTTQMSVKMVGSHLTDKNSLDFDSAHQRSHRIMNNQNVANDYNHS